jgi:primosomal protein N' (replication factor Y)
MLGRGGERHTEEIGRAFPNFPTHYSTADAQIADLPNTPSLVIATSGMEPRIEGGYAAVILLEGDSFFSYNDLRAQERARETFFVAAACVSKEGAVITVVNQSNPISSALAQWSPKVLATRELGERRELNFPPFSRTAVMEVESSEATSIVSGFKKALLDKRLPASTAVLGPAQSTGNVSRILLTADLADSGELLKFVGDYIRHRAVTKKKSLTIRVDPYSLT